MAEEKKKFMNLRDAFNAYYEAEARDAELKGEEDGTQDESS